MAKVAEYKRIDVEVIESQMPMLDEDGNETGEFETIRKEVPIMGTVYRDATPEEEAEQARLDAEMPEPEQTPEERIEELEAKNEMLEECLIELANIIFA